MPSSSKISEVQSSEPVQVNARSVLRSVSDALGQARVIAVIRANTPEDALWGAENLIERGISVVEITFSTPNAADVIRQLNEAFGQRPGVLTGAGTVLTSDEFFKACDAGSQFVVSPVLTQDFLTWGRERDLLTIPGVATPTEMVQAAKWGASVVKVFPAACVGGPAFLKAIRKPVLDRLGDLKVIPTGGVTPENMTEYLNQGAWAVGLGGQLISPGIMEERNMGALEKNVLECQQRLERFRQQ